VIAKPHETIRWIPAVAIAALLLSVPAGGQPALDPDICASDGSGLVSCLTGADDGSPLPPPLRGRTDPTWLVGYPAFDYWSLDTSGVRDSAARATWNPRLPRVNRTSLMRGDHEEDRPLRFACRNARRVPWLPIPHAVV
jgi:hypothetical protein